MKTHNSVSQRTKNIYRDWRLDGWSDIDNLLKEIVLQNATAEEPGWSQRDVAKHINGKFSGRKKERNRTTWTNSKDNLILLVKQSRGDKVWIALTVCASGLRIPHIGYNRRIAYDSWKKKKKWTGLQFRSKLKL